MVSIPRVLAQYAAHHPEESDRLLPLRQLVAQTVQPHDLIARTNFAGHVTASGFVLNATCSAVLLVYHNGLDMYVQPGGHLELPDASLLDGARREVREEVGLDTVHTIATFEDPAIPFDIDSHYIPPNPRKGEPAHWHHDFRYAFRCPDNAILTLATKEVTAPRWVPLEQLGSYPTLEIVAEKLTKARLIG